MLYTNFSCVILLISIVIMQCSKDWTDEIKRSKWMDYSKNRINKMLERKINGNVAKNVILFVGDGMGLSTVTAGRILKGQLKGDNGEELVTAMENLDHSALSKTYEIDAQTADSAGSATAFLTGVKTKINKLGVDGTGVDCKTTKDASLETVLKWAHFAGKSVGVVSTARFTHATPAATYANSFDRDMETFDGKYYTQKDYDNGCKDIAAQFIEKNTFINVVFAGGRRKFMRKSDSDYKNSTNKGDRIDNRNLINEWEQKMTEQKMSHKFVWNSTEFDSLKPNQYDHVFGLLHHDHMEYELFRQKDEPSLSDMTKKAIELLSVNPKGYFLLVESGKIDHAHHNSWAKLALNEFVEFDNAIAESVKMTDSSETLTVVTADHSHVFTIGAYSRRGNDLFGLNFKVGGLLDNGNLDNNNLTYTPLLYANGPGKLNKIRNYNLTYEQTNDPKYHQESAILLTHETHAGEDVSIYASGPMSYLFDGTVEQSYIAHVMAYSACLGPYNSTNYPNCKSSRGVLIEERKEMPKSIGSKLLSKNKFYLFIVSLFTILNQNY